MTASKELITVHVNVENAKKIAGRDEKGVYRVDTADWVGKMISNASNTGMPLYFPGRNGKNP